jgi:competence protein ComEA
MLSSYGYICESLNKKRSKRTLMHNSWKEYFVFTKKERVGIIVLVILILLCIVLPFYCPSPQSQVDEKSLAQLQKQIELPKKVQNDSNEVGEKEFVERVLPQSNLSLHAKLFKFDPNTLTEQGWQQLAVKDKTIRTIQHYLSKGGHFKRPEDLTKIYGLSPGEYERLLPFVVISKPAVDKLLPIPKEYYKTSFEPHPKRISYNSAPIDINTQDTADWISLPAIGNGLARRIMNFRDKLGGFYSIDQVAETYGLADSTFQLIKSLLKCSLPALRTINLNTAGVEILRQHPYIRWKLANVIVQYRQQHGPFTTIQELANVSVISPELYQKIAPYLSLE